MEAFIMPILIVIVTVVAIVALMANNKAGGSSHGQISGLIEQAMLAKQSSDFEQSAMLYSRALDLIDNMKSIDESLLSECLVTYSTVLDRQGKRKESEIHRNRLLSIWNNALASGNEDLLSEVDYLCINAEFGAQTIDVANYYERLLALREKTKPQSGDVFINTVVIYSRLMRSLGETQIADDLEAHADGLRQGGKNARQTDAPELDNSNFETKEADPVDIANADLPNHVKAEDDSCQNDSLDENNTQSS